MNAVERLDEIQKRLEAELSPESLQVEDESHLHIGHEGAKSGLGHFRVLVVSDRFQGLSPIKRHRLIYQAMDELMQTDIHALAIDARNNPDEQKMLLAACADRRIRCAELALPMFGAGGRPAPSPASADAEERRAARELLLSTLRLGAEHGVSRVVLFPTLLPLRAHPWDRVVHDFASKASLELALQALDEERAACAPAALDALCLTLEPALQHCLDLEVELIFPLPGPLPRQLPDAPEVAALIELFAGAPLGACLCADWIHVLQHLRGDVPDLAALSPPSCLRLADACGLSPMLPPGTGEIGWPGPLYELEGTREVDQVIAVAPGASRAELEVSRELLGRILAVEG